MAKKKSNKNNKLALGVLGLVAVLALALLLNGGGLTGGFVSETHEECLKQAVQLGVDCFKETQDQSACALILTSEAKICNDNLE